MATPPKVEWTSNTVRHAYHVRCTPPEPVLSVGAGCAVSSGSARRAKGWTDMSYVIAAPEVMTAAASDLAGIESALSAAHAAAATSTTQVLAAAGDEVSAAIAAVFSAHGQQFQLLGAQAAAFHDQFVQALTARADSFASTEAQAVNT